MDGIRQDIVSCGGTREELPMLSVVVSSAEADVLAPSERLIAAMILTTSFVDHFIQTAP